ncbi:hypothetical protein RAC69_15685 [Microbacterium sp. LS_15]|uniref:hypothetical protein n=1 Tax=Microbacterium sp. LS_15 TaxID=3055790 RepID=UPI0035BEF176
MGAHGIPTRTTVRLATAALAVTTLLGLGVAPAAAAQAAAADWYVDPAGEVDYERSADLAYEFLDDRVDEYCSADAMCLPRSYQGGFFTTPDWDYTSSFLYDDALIVMAYAARGLPDDIRRAQSIGDALLFVQANEPVFSDGRTRASYQPVSLREGAVEIGSGASNTGNQAWVGMALARLFDLTGEQRYLDGALRLADWIVTNTVDTDRGPFGYIGGQDAEGNSLTFKSTEHNIDVTAFFTQLSVLTGDASWTDRAALAAGFVAAMQTDDGFLWTGTHTDGVSTNYYPVPLDPQTWSFLATGDERYGSALAWTVENLHAVDAPYEGPAFSSADVSKVWFEGTGQLALALRLRDAPEDAAYTRSILAAAELAQRQAGNGDGRGIVAASSDGLDTGFGDLYYSSLHTGATSWYLLALAAYNPFRLDDDDATPPVTGTPTAPEGGEASGAALSPSDSASAAAALAESGGGAPLSAAFLAGAAVLAGAALLRRRGTARR